MARKSMAFGVEMVRFKHALDQLNANRADFKGFEDRIKALEDGVAALETLNAQQEALKAQLREKTEELNNKRDDTRRTYGELKRVWKAKYGVNTAKAKAYDIEEGTLRSARNDSNN